MFGNVAAQSASQVLRIVCGYPPGGSTDFLCRAAASGLQAAGYAASVVVENKAGGAGAVGAAYVKQMPADGATILQVSLATLTLQPLLEKNLPFDATNDFVPLTVATSTDAILAVGKAVPESVRTIQQYIEWTKLAPTNGNVAATGSISPLIIGALGQATNVRLNPVLYRGGQPAMLDAMGGNIPALFTSISESNAFVKEGRLRSLAICADERSKFAPDLPTFKELGIPNMAHPYLYPFFVRSGTPAQIIASHSAALQNALRQKALVDTMDKAMQNVLATSQQKAVEMMAQDRVKWTELVAKVPSKS